MNDLLKLLLASTSGYKTYVAGAGLIGLGLYHFSTGDAVGGIQFVSQGLGLLGLRHALETTGADPGGPVVLPFPTPPAPPPGPSPEAIPAPPGPPALPTLQREHFCTLYTPSRN